MTSGSSPALIWGSTPAERELPYPCDRYIAHPHGAYFRAVDVDAPAAIVFRWLCQLRVTPYSYDWIDNFGRRSPQTLTPGLEQLELGQTFMTGVADARVPVRASRRSSARTPRCRWERPGRRCRWRWW
jgi:hypothetical protein